MDVYGGGVQLHEKKKGPCFVTEKIKYDKTENKK